MTKITGHLTIIKKTSEGEEVLFKSNNAISGGLAYSMINMLTSVGAQDSKDFAVKYFQLGSGSLSGYLPDRTTERRFLQLASPFSEAQYGTSAIVSPVTLPQLVAPNGNFTNFTDLSETSAVFLPIRRGVKSLFNRTGLSVRLNIDQNMANNTTISEIGIFLKNPTGSPNQDKPILMAYKTFPGVAKNSDFSIIIDWKIQIRDANSQRYSSELGGGQGLTSYQVVPVDMVSGTATTSNAGTGDNYTDRFEVLVPSALQASDAGRAPLVVIFNDFGDQVDSYVRFSALAAQLNERGWYGVVPLGKSTNNINDNTLSGVHNHSKATLYNMNSRVALNHVNKVVNYVRDHYLINSDRIYFYGFGMGGGCALNFASLLLDDSQEGSWRPAAVISHNGLLSTRYTWWCNAPSTLSSYVCNSSGCWGGEYPKPPNASLLPMGKAITFWCASANDPSGPISHIPGELTENGVNGTDWASVSNFTPTKRPYRYLENSVVDFNLNTSADLWVSTCTLLNLTHVPMYIHWVTDNPSGPAYYLPTNILSGYLATGTYGNAFTYELKPSATGTHHVSSINIAEALEFCSSKTKPEVLSASTVITREGYYWGMFVNTYLEPDTEGDYWHLYQNSALTASVGLSGLGYWIWEKDPDTNSLTIKASWAIYNDNGQNVNITVSDLGFGTIDVNNPLIITTLSSLDLAASAGGFLYWNDLNYPHPWYESQTPPDSDRRITLLNFSALSIVFYEETSPGVFGPAQICTRYKGSAPALLGSWRTPNPLTVRAKDTNTVGGNLILLRRGKFEIVPAP